MARKSGALDTTRIPASKPEEIDKIGIVKEPMRQPRMMKAETQEAFGDLEFSSDVLPEFISPLGILGFNPEKFDVKFQDDVTSVMGEYSPETDRMLFKDARFHQVTIDGEPFRMRTEILRQSFPPTSNDPKESYRQIADKDNITIEHEAIHRGLNILRNYYTYDEVAKKFNTETADYLFKAAFGPKEHLAELFTELNDARRLGLKDFDTYVKRFKKSELNPDGYTEESLKALLDQSLSILPNLEELAKERLYDRNPKGGPTDDARSLPTRPAPFPSNLFGKRVGSLDEGFYKPYKEGVFSKFVGTVRDKFNQFMKKDEPNFEETSKQMPKQFNKGGDVMKEQMEMAFMQEGGLKDDGMDKDPVSGNEVPSGSLAEEVRDDIPVQLSEGEYVVPADVVRFFGVKFFEDLRMQAKMGLAQMEESGRIGGEPIKEPMSVTVVESEEMLDPEDEKKIREMLKGFNEGGLQDFRKAPPPLDLRKDFGVVGGSLFRRKPKASEDDIIDGKADGTVTYYHPDGREFKVEYKGGAVVNENQIQYTVPPWSRTKPNETPNVSSSEVGGSSGDDSRPSGGAKFAETNLVEKYSYLNDKEEFISTEILANQHNKDTGENRLAFFDDNGNPVPMTKQGYDNLYNGYTSLGGDKNFPGGISQYANLGFRDKLALMPQQIRKAFGYDVSEARIKQILKASQDRKTLSRMQVNPSILSFILDIISPDKTLFSRNLTAREASPDATEPLNIRQKVIRDLSQFTTDIDGTVGAEGFTNFGKFLQGQTNSKFGMTAIDRALLGVKMDGDQPMIYDGGLGRDRKLTGSDLAEFASNMDSIRDANKFRHKVFMETGDAMLADEAYHQAFLDQSADITRNQQLASEARRKEKQSVPSDEQIIKDAKAKADAKAEAEAKAKAKEAVKTAINNPFSDPEDSGGDQDSSDDFGSVFDSIPGFGGTPAGDSGPDFGSFYEQASQFHGDTSYSDGTYYGVGNKGGLFTKKSVAKKNGLASKPKAKAKRKRNTKGLGTKPKAT